MEDIFICLVSFQSFIFVKMKRADIVCIPNNYQWKLKAQYQCDAEWCPNQQRQKECFWNSKSCSLRKLVKFNVMKINKNIKKMFTLFCLWFIVFKLRKYFRLYQRNISFWLRKLSSPRSNTASGLRIVNNLPLWKNLQQRHRASPEVWRVTIGGYWKMVFKFFDSEVFLYFYD